ncbi:hypothetical protein OJAV_G00027440 [Oryzias javanicus]|uniref:CTCK domain-containing protein n=1 Tax=Oryzias javanicus TaxID=123683 RepID=A0A437DJN9_ORYJA|nr:hypothetical protein OJAV_G00027440 [Oryzias javanicus]
MSTVSTTPPCECVVSGTAYSSGVVVYNVTDGLGWCYVAFCNESCEVETHSSPCPTTPEPSRATPSTTPVFDTTTEASLSSTTLSISTSSISPSTALLDCNDVSPPKQNGESWLVGNCSTATCSNGKISTTPIICPSVQAPICTNGHKPVQVYDADGCCFHYECECVCSVWGGSHFLTLDGKSYSFNETCSHYLVKEIISRYNLTISTSRDCGASETTLCPLAISISYQSYVVVLSQSVGTDVHLMAFINQKRVYLGYSNSALRLLGTDMAMGVVIPEINATVVYRGSSFSIDLPHALFGGNTEGLCGTCDNSQVNDCRAPDGQVESCSDSAHQWSVPGEPCIPPFSPNTVNPPQCEAVLCEVLTSSVFSACHALVPPGPFVAACQRDVCSGGNGSCSSLEAYATECAMAGVCMDWRGATGGQCEHECPSGKEYRACGPSVEPTCSDRLQDGGASSLSWEGCFCPPGSTLFNRVHDTCVTSCYCVGPDGGPKQPGESWTSGCSSCRCDQDSMSVQCTPLPCPEVRTLQRAGSPARRHGGCVCGPAAPRLSAKCNLDLCAPPITCPLGFSLRASNGTCCQNYQCVPKGVCVHDQAEFTPGASVQTAGGLCQDCVCSLQTDPLTQLHVIACSPVLCNSSCAEGFEYDASGADCCGECVQKSCVITLEDQSTHTVEVNHTYVPPHDQCAQFRCERINGQLVTKETRTSCPPFDPADCEPGTESTDAAGCCRSCRLRSDCRVSSQQSSVEVDGCASAPLNLTSCEGGCRSSSRYSAAANAMTYQCECCREDATSRRQVELTCADGSKVQHTYIHVESCRCSRQDCAGGTTRAQRRRRR